MLKIFLCIGVSFRKRKSFFQKRKNLFLAIAGDFPACQFCSALNINGIVRYGLREACQESAEVPGVRG